NLLFKKSRGDNIDNRLHRCKKRHIGQVQPLSWVARPSTGSDGLARAVTACLYAGTATGVPTKEASVVSIVVD
ncbi:MAG: hypothetical protein ACLQMO_07055, partial [Acidobacteriaceae bacterium]